MTPARTRIAPSPTGDPHVGTAYQSLFDYVLARQTGGQFVFRLEDTDQQRYDAGSDQALFESLRWVGLLYDEGPDIGGPFAPYRQSERLAIYRRYADILVDQGDAYPCFCTPARLAEMRKAQEARREPPRYDRLCLNLPKEEVTQRLESGERHVIRMRVPDSGHTGFIDMVRGEISFENRLLDDQVIMKSDGFPTYHLAVVVDDHEMEISHVIRGEEWIPSTPKHVLLYQFFGWQPPIYAHTPLLLNDDRTKISKRKSPEKTRLLGFRERGYLPEALLNFLAHLGWSHPEGKEVYGLDELIRLFSLDRLLKAGSVFDLKKLLWMNGMYIREMPLEQLAGRVQLYSRRTPEEIRQVLPILQERLKLLTEFDELSEFFFAAPAYDPAMFISKQFGMAELAAKLEEIRFWLAAQRLPWEKEEWEAGLREVAESLGFKKAGDLFMLLRVAITGRRETPPLFDSMMLLGYDESLRRIEAAAVALRRIEARAQEAAAGDE